jgi:uncharacterized peroxidase-related enzyme
MTYLTPPDDMPLYDTLRERLGYLPNYGHVFGLAPDAYLAWTGLNTAIKAGMDEARYELVTVAAARQLGSSYCVRAHTAVLREKFYDDETLRSIVSDPQRAGLSAADAAAVDFAERIAVDPRAASQADMDALREQGLTDRDIFQVVLAVAARRFFAGVLSAVGAAPDSVYDSLDESLVAL